MSGVKNIRIALETALAAMAPSLATAWENTAFAPPASSVPYQRAYILFSTPDNQEFGASHIQQGIFQINLLYPLQAGPADAADRAELIRASFRRGFSFTNSGVTVNITRTPEVGQGLPDGDRWLVPVKVRFSSFIL